MDASLKSVLGNPLTGLVYAASLAVGVITLLAFYESPISPLPVPSLPKPPVGRFPPEHSVWPPVSKHPVKAGPQYAASNQHMQFTLPQSIDKIPNQNQYVGGYEKANVATHTFALNNGIEHGYSAGHLTPAASTVYNHQVVPNQQHKRVANVQPGRPLTSQLPVITRKAGHTESNAHDSAPVASASEPKVSVTSADADSASKASSSVTSEQQ